jgi:hypothetical protein
MRLSERQEKERKGEEERNSRRRETHSLTQFPNYSHDEVPPVVD